MFSEIETGRLIMEQEQNGLHRAAYGKYLIPELSKYLIERIGRGGWSNGQMLSDHLRNLEPSQSHYICVMLSRDKLKN